MYWSHIAQIQTKGRMAWQKSTGYNKRSRAETQMGRWKAVIGPKLKARHFDGPCNSAVPLGVARTSAKTGRSEALLIEAVGHAVRNITLERPLC